MLRFIPKSRFSPNLRFFPCLLIYLRLPRALLLALLLLLSGTAAAERPIPALTARVTDLTATLSSEQSRALESELAGLEQRSGAQLAVLLLPTTQPETIEQYSLRVVEAWKLGQKAKDNGLLLLVAKQDRKIRIEVGYGLEGVIPDVIAKRIISEAIAPRLKNGDFAGGIQAGVAQLSRLIEPAAVPTATPPTAENNPSSWITSAIGILLGIALVIGMLFMVARFPGGFIGLLLGGIAALASGQWLVGLLFWILSTLLLSHLLKRWDSKHPHGVGYVDSSAGYGSESSSSSGGDYGGGGGSFGGGGASGDF